ncbi:MAG: hypothetical protein ABF241_03465 [Yoonia sp.]
MDRWQTVYEARNRILAKSAVTLDDLVKKYGDDPSELLASKDWLQNYRPVLNFFEFLGVILSNDVFDQKSITAHMFTLVTVDAFSAEGDVDEQTLIAPARSMPIWGPIWTICAATPNTALTSTNSTMLFCCKNMQRISSKSDPRPRLVKDQVAELPRICSLLGCEVQRPPLRKVWLNNLFQRLKKSFQ